MSGRPTTLPRELVGSLLPIRWGDTLKSSYDVVIIGGGGHGLSTAYHLATRHGITNIAVIEAEYIAADKAGHDVARLHSGDLSVWSAVAEQMRRLDALGIGYTLTPGVPALSLSTCWSPL